ncbi:F-box protein At4g22390-like isoform X2 [Papaver somniferum]|uniref:F-box protein At4g22390-like isoform X2 n=1 Tax=Papaver somniferum TaxID=3469 RepID=UPI000E703551|nr:F-box protein At4g22390-like isoform X2 [Papaver somniferum]
METVEFSCPLSSEIPILHSITYGFVYDSNIEDYKVVKVMDLGPHGSEISVYTLTSNSWRWVQHMPYGFFVGRRPGVFVNGALHWIATHVNELRKSESILSFNIRDEGIQEVLKPQDVNVSNVTLGLLGECLCLVSQHPMARSDVWVLKDHGVTNSWTKLFSVNQQTAIDGCRILNPIFAFKSSEILFENMNDFNLLVYDPEHGSVIIPKVRGTPMCSYYTTINVRSLVSLDSVCEWWSYS